VLAGDARALDEQLHAFERGRILVPELAVDADDLDPAPLERLRGRRAGAGETEDENALQRRK
jgi:hypothetical protein